MRGCVRCCAREVIGVSSAVHREAHTKTGVHKLGWGGYHLQYTGGSMSSRIKIRISRNRYITSLDSSTFAARFSMYLANSLVISMDDLLSFPLKESEDDNALSDFSSVLILLSPTSLTSSSSSSSSSSSRVSKTVNEVNRSRSASSVTG